MRAMGGGIHASHGGGDSCEPWEGQKIMRAMEEGVDPYEPWEGGFMQAMGEVVLKALLLLVFLPFLNQLFSLTF